MHTYVHQHLRPHLGWVLGGWTTLAASTRTQLANTDELTEADLMRWRWLAATHMFHYISAGFHVYPKFHYFMHMPQQVRQLGNVRSFWCYSEESKNRDAKRLWKVSSKGHAVEQQILLHTMWSFALQRQVHAAL